MTSKATRITVTIAVLFVVSAAVVVGWAMWLFARPTNARDNADPAKQAEMLAITLETADLAPIPKNATITSIQTEGNMFTRSFRVTYTAKPGVIDKWLNASKGIKHAKASRAGQVTKYIIEKPKNDFNYADVIIDHPKNKVLIYVSNS